LTKHEFISFARTNIAELPSATERWLSDRITQSPELLELGRCTLVSREFPISPDGRVDLIFDSEDGRCRYIVEIQRGTFDDDHLVRLVDYAALSAEQAPGMVIHAVAIAEDFTPRAHRVAFALRDSVNIALHRIMVYRRSDVFTWFCCPVFRSELFRRVRPLNGYPAVPDKDKMRSRCAPSVCDMLEWYESQLLAIDPDLILNYTQAYIGISYRGSPVNFVTIRPRYECCIFEFRTVDTEQARTLLHDFEQNFLDYDTRTSRFRVRVFPEDVVTRGNQIEALTALACLDCPNIESKISE